MLRQTGLIICFVILLVGSARADDELSRYSGNWPTQPPFDSWSVESERQSDWELRIIVRHKHTDEAVELVWQGRDENQPAYERTKTYNLFYRSQREDKHTSPELEKLLPAWAGWAKRIETEATQLRKPSDVLDERKKIKEEREAIRLERIAAEKAREKQKYLEKYGLARLLGKGNTPQISMEMLRVWFLILLLPLLIFMYPRINQIEYSVSGEDYTRYMVTLKLWLPICVAAVIIFALKAGGEVNWTEWISYSQIQKNNSLLLTGNWLLSGYSVFGSVQQILIGFISALFLVFTAILIGWIAHLLFWDRRISLFAVLVYIGARLLAPPYSDPVSALLFDIAWCVFVFASYHQAYDTKNSWRLGFAFPAGLLMIWLDPAAVVMIFFYIVYLVFESEDLKRNIANPFVWLVPMLIFLLASPVFAAYLAESSDATLGIAFFGGWHSAERLTLFAAAVSAVALLPALLSLVFITKDNWKLVCLLFAYIIGASLFSVGLNIQTTSIILKGESLAPYALLSGVFIGALVKRVRADERYWAALVLVLVMVFLSLYSLQSFS